MHIFLNVFICFALLSFVALCCQYSALSSHEHTALSWPYPPRNLSSVAPVVSSRALNEKKINVSSEFPVVTLREMVLRRARASHEDVNISSVERKKRKEEKLKKKEELLRKKQEEERKREERLKRTKMLEAARDTRSSAVRPACEQVDYLINPSYSWCPLHADQPVLVILVASAPQNGQKRHLIRQTWGSVRACGGVLMHVRFFIGETSEGVLVAQEARDNRDIIQQTFHDSYNNLTLKTLGALAWTTEYCKVAKYALKTDDDTFINIFNVAKFLQTSPSTESFLCAGTMKTGIVNRVRANKWYVSKEAWPKYLFPPYCHGFGYFLPVSKIPAMLEKSCTVQKITVEDAYMGIVAYHLNITHVYPATEPKKLLRNPSAIITDSSSFPLALWTSKSPMDGGRFKKVLDDFERYQSTLLFVAHLEDVDIWRQLWTRVQQNAL